MRSMAAPAAEEAANPERAYRWQRFAGTRAEWAAGVRRRLLAWGFNTAGGVVGAAERDRPAEHAGTRTRAHGPTSSGPIPFDPALIAELRRKAAVAVAPYRGNPLRIGYFSDNEIGWWNGPLFVAYLTYPPENHTKRRLVAMLRERYRDNWHAFERDFVPAPGTASFDDLLAARAAPRLRPGGNGIEAVRAWTAIVAGRYYSAMREALRAADPGGALSRRPAADLLRPGRRARDGALRRRDLGQLQRRHRRWLDRAVFLRRAARSERRQAGPGHRMVLRRGGEPVGQSEPHRAAARRGRGADQQQPQPHRPSDDRRDTTGARPRRRPRGAASGRGART